MLSNPVPHLGIGNKQMTGLDTKESLFANGSRSAHRVGGPSTRLVPVAYTNGKKRLCWGTLSKLGHSGSRPEERTFSKNPIISTYTSRLQAYVHVRMDGTFYPSLPPVTYPSAILARPLNNPPHVLNQMFAGAGSAVPFVCSFVVTGSGTRGKGKFPNRVNLAFLQFAGIVLPRDVGTVPAGPTSVSVANGRGPRAVACRWPERDEAEHWKTVLQW